jgi:2-C-methyl-D-erythritol 4-phosphate cytidylyltransferase
MPIPPFSVVITAAGLSARFKDDDANGSVKKEFMSIDGHSVLYRAAVPFFSIPGLAAVAVTYDPQVEAQTKYALEDLVLQHSIPVLMVEGGETRQKSVFNALQALSSNGLSGDFVMIHDGARPYVQLGSIYQVFGQASVSGAAAGAIKVSDAVVEATDDGFIKRHVDRSGLYLIQTPQIFRFQDILKAHQMASDDGVQYPDDTSVYQKYIGKVALCQGDERNRKITWPHDLESD